MLAARTPGASSIGVADDEAFAKFAEGTRAVGNVGDVICVSPLQARKVNPAVPCAPWGSLSWASI